MVFLSLSVETILRRLGSMSLNWAETKVLVRSAAAVVAAVASMAVGGGKGADGPFLLDE